jgi:hypothetical protein
VRRATLVLALVLAAPAAAPSAAHAVRPPRLGSWEGHGSHGLSMSFRLVRHGRYIDVGRGGFTVSTPTFNALCPAGPENAAAQHWDHASYGGPSSYPVLPIFHYGPRDVSFDINDPGSFASFSGKLRNRHTMVLKEPYTGHQPRGCGWPRTLRWVVHPRHRAQIADGTWTGTTSGQNGLAGSVAVTVVGSGHVVDDFRAVWRCGDGGGPGSGVTAPMAEEFIHADGTFSGPLGASRVNGEAQRWTGRFAGATLNGTLHTWNVCTGQGPLDVSFTAAPG